MAGGIWTPATQLLSTVVEYQSFSHVFEYYEEFVSAGAIDQITGLPGADVITLVYYPIRLTQISPYETVSIVNGSYITQPTQQAPNQPINPATLSGFYRYVFFDTLIYRDYNETVKTLTGTANHGAWELFDMNDCYQMVEFIPDNNRFRRFEFLAEAFNSQNEVVSTMTYYIDVSDRNWTPGKNSLKGVVQTIRNRGG